MKGSNSFLLHVSDFLLDENVAAMDLAQIGAYIVLLAFANREGSIPSDKRHITRLLKLTPDEFEQVWDGLSPCFVPIEIDGKQRMINPRLAKQNEDYQAFRERRQDNGRKGGASKHKQKLASAKKGLSKTLAKSSSRNDNENSTYNNNRKEGAGGKPDAGFPAWLKPEDWQRFRDFRKRRDGKVLSEDAENLNLRKLDELRKEGNSPVAVIDQTIACGWATFYPLKNQQNGKGKSAPAVEDAPMRMFGTEAKQ